MHAKAFVAALLSAAAVHAAIVPGPAKRDIISDLTSVAGDATSFVASDFSAATSAAASLTSSIGSVVDSAIEAEKASSLFAEVTSELGTSTTGVFAILTTVSGTPIVEVTSAGGSAITLATSTGQTTSFGGHTNVANAAALVVSKPAFVSAVAVLGSILAGAAIVL
ncbi:hypothetical protein A0H81_11470 [Grifola frondosa]|uniref:Uncharacterized protein n=1 Tax=Grifola frondosa TaxID=5627 RepID=A0A1C7LX85_GRIFR|nr:hypothetical protein A0H81_11470 [Grifola frondosa]